MPATVLNKNQIPARYYVISFAFQGVGVASGKLCHSVAIACTLPASLTGSQIKAQTAATASSTYTIKKNGSSIGTLGWAASGTVPTITFASQVSLAVGDVVEIDEPSTPDATLADISASLLATI